MLGWARAVSGGVKPRCRRRKCLCCKRIFLPDPRTRHQQQFCSDRPCQKASKKVSQERWRAKPENRDYWRGPEHVERVRAWREAHPWYWKRAARQARVRYKI